MNYHLSFLPEVEEDAILGYFWYEEKAVGLGEDFLRLFYACANEIARTPLLFGRVHGDFRRRLLKRVPFALYFTTKEDHIVVLGLFHCARNPVLIEHVLDKRIL